MTITRRAVLFGPPVPLAAVAWEQLGQPAHLAGLAVLCTLALLAVPLLILPVVLVPHVLLSLLVPRKWRKEWRHRRPRNEQRSSRISKRIRRAVFAADRNTCIMHDADCSGRLNVDHVRPWSQGGLTWLLNLLTLCEFHNLVKSNYWPGVFYRPWDGYDDKRGAAIVLAAERRARLNPARWLRAAWYA
jgi:5-methylcytosine-specific restriction endonuclease McrA